MTAIVTVDNASYAYTVRRGLRRERVLAVDGVSLAVATGEVLGIVGPSGSGKSTLARLMLGLLRPTSGRIIVAGRDTAALARAERRSFHRSIQPVFQNPGQSLNPRQRVGAILTAPLAVHGIGGHGDRIAEALRRVGLAPELTRRYPHELSGGQRQLVAVARALIAGPSILVADEPTASLDMIAAAALAGLLGDLRRDLGLTLIFISHDSDWLAAIADRIVVIRSGRLSEPEIVGAERVAHLR